MWFSTVIEIGEKQVVYRVFVSDGRAYFSPSNEYLKEAPTFRAFKESGFWTIRELIDHDLARQVSNLQELM